MSDAGETVSVEPLTRETYTRDGGASAASYHPPLRVFRSDALECHLGSASLDGSGNSRRETSESGYTTELGLISACKLAVQLLRRSARAIHSCLLLRGGI